MSETARKQRKGTSLDWVLKIFEEADYSIPYEKALEITRDAVDRVIKDLLKDVPARVINLDYGPGAYADGRTLPMANLQVQAPIGSVRVLVDSIGYLLDLNEVRVMRQNGIDGFYAVDIVRTDRQRDFPFLKASTGYCTTVSR